MLVQTHHENVVCGPSQSFLESTNVCVVLLSFFHHPKTNKLVPLTLQASQVTERWIS